MSDQRVLILDGSHSLYDTGPSRPDGLGLRPIPRFREIVLEAAREVLASGQTSPGKIVFLNVGVVCETAVVRALGRAIHTEVVNKG